MIRIALLASLGALVCPCVAAAAEQWGGTIQCAVITGLNTKALKGDFEMQADGAKLTYTRPVHISDTTAISGVDELGHGTRTGDVVQLQGGASGAGYSYVSTYSGKIVGSTLTLVGEQIWQAKKVVDFHRDCRIVLQRR